MVRRRQPEPNAFCVSCFDPRTKQPPLPFYTNNPEEDVCPACLLTPKQRELNLLLAGPQRHTLLYGGARSGKTVLFVRGIMLRAIRAEGSRQLMARLRSNAARASLWLETLPKVNEIFFPQIHLKDHRQDGFVEVVETGSEIWIAGTDDKDRVEKILGKEFLTIYFNECSQLPYSTILMC